MADDEYEIPNDDDVTPDDIQPGADLEGADLSEAKLRDSNLSEAKLADVDLSEADLEGANLSRAELTDADLIEARLITCNLTDAYLRKADFTGADLRIAELTGAYLSDAIFTESLPRNTDFTDSILEHADFTDANLALADFTDANLRDADFSNVKLIETNFTNATLSRNTNIEIDTQTLHNFSNLHVNDLSEEEQWDVVARMHHELREAYSENGLISQARKARVRERRARRKEAKTEDSLRGTLAWAGSLASRFVTGYGVQIWPVALLMILLWFGSATVYTLYGGMVWADSLYFSVVTFTTSPPPEPALSGISRFVAGVETFLGTTAIVFLGYVLGTRERV